MRKKAYFVDVDSFGVDIVEFTYEKRTPQIYVGCEMTRNVMGRTYYFAKRQSQEKCFESERGALAEAEKALMRSLELAKAKTQAVNSHLGMVRSALRKATADSTDRLEAGAGLADSSTVAEPSTSLSRIAEVKQETSAGQKAGEGPRASMQKQNQWNT